MWSRLFLTSLCLLSVLAARPLVAAGNDVQLQMEHAIDQQCDGITDTTAKAIPGNCIIYTVTAINTSNTIYRNISISAHIPEHTTLVQAYRYSHNKQPLPSTTSNNTDGIKLIETRLDALKPGEANEISVHYSVKIR